jgi:hypothetical protein
LIKAVKMAEIWKEEEAALGAKLVTRNCAKDPQVKPWVQDCRKNLQQVGITTVKELQSMLSNVNDLLQENGEAPFAQSALDLMSECLQSRALNTGHIVFASGPAVKKGEGEVRIQVVHSTKHGKKDENGNVIEGVREHYRRFQLVQHQDGSVSFTRGMKQAPSTESNDEDNNPQDDMEEDEEDENNGIRTAWSVSHEV